MPETSAENAIERAPRKSSFANAFLQFVLLFSCAMLAVRGGVAAALFMVGVFCGFRLARRQPAQSADSAQPAVAEKPLQIPPDLGHEIRTPMNGVLGMSHLLSESELTPEQREWVAIIRISSEYLLEIVNDALDLSKIESGCLILEKHPFDLRQLVDSCVQILKQRTRDKNIEFIVEVDASIPRFVAADGLRLRQVLLNLLANALKFTPQQGGMILQVFVRSRDESAMELHFAVTDTGVGISAEQLPRIFQAYSQAGDSIARKFGGTGLGLTICKRMTELWGGAIWVQSRMGLGSAFHFTLPVEIVRQEPEPASAGEKPVRQRPLRILLAEDNRVNQKLAAHLLIKRGFEVEIANDGREACSLLEQGDFDLVLMDCQMPVMSGFEAAASHRAREARTGGRVPIVALTAEMGDDNKMRCFEAGMDEFLLKPIHPDELFRMIDRLICE